MEQSQLHATALADGAVLLILFLLAVLAAVLPWLVIIVGLPVLALHRWVVARIEHKRPSSRYSAKMTRPQSGQSDS